MVHQVCVTDSQTKLLQRCSSQIKMCKISSKLFKMYYYLLVCRLVISSIVITIVTSADIQWPRKSQSISLKCVLVNFYTKLQNLLAAKQNRVATNNSIIQLFEYLGPNSTIQYLVFVKFQEQILFGIHIFPGTNKIQYSIKITIHGNFAAKGA